MNLSRARLAIRSMWRSRRALGIISLWLRAGNRAGLLQDVAFGVVWFMGSLKAGLEHRPNPYGKAKNVPTPGPLLS